jgi:hypothetical protein
MNLRRDGAILAGLVVVGLLFLAAACGGGPPNPYPAEMVENFVASCRTRTDETVCRCSIDRIQRRYSVEEFKAFEARMSNGHVVPELLDTVAECVKR